MRIRVSFLGRIREKWARALRGWNDVEYGAMAKYPVCFGRVLVCLESAKKWKIKN